MLQQPKWRVWYLVGKNHFPHAALTFKLYVCQGYLLSLVAEVAGAAVVAHEQEHLPDRILEHLQLRY